MKAIGRNIRAIRERKNLTQESIASDLGISRISYAKIEGGQTLPNTKRIQEIAAILKVRPEQFYADQDAINIAAPTNSSISSDSNPALSLVVSEALLKDIQAMMKEIIKLLQSK